VRVAGRLAVVVGDEAKNAEVEAATWGIFAVSAEPENMLTAIRKEIFMATFTLSSGTFS
jgi:hypothetical protein